MFVSCARHLGNYVYIIALRIYTETVIRIYDFLVPLLCQSMMHYISKQVLLLMLMYFMSIYCKPNGRADSD